MHIYILRHGIAEEHDAALYPNDSLRPLTDKGREKLVISCRGLAHLDLTWNKVMTSPYARALETAEIVSRFFKIHNRVHITKNMIPGVSTKVLTAEINKEGAEASVMIVGHEPSLSQHLSFWISGHGEGHFHLKKGGFACVSFDGLAKVGSGKLEYFLSPMLMARLGKR